MEVVEGSASGISGSGMSMPSFFHRPDRIKTISQPLSKSGLSNKTSRGSGSISLSVELERSDEENEEEEEGVRERARTGRRGPRARAQGGKDARSRGRRRRRLWQCSRWPAKLRGSVGVGHDMSVEWCRQLIQYIDCHALLYPRQRCVIKTFHLVLL